MKKKPNKFLAPIVIAGVTIGFLASAYKFVFAKSESVQQGESQPNVSLESTAEHAQGLEQSEKQK